MAGITLIDELKETIKINLGGSMIDVELEPQDYETAIKNAVAKYRQRSPNALEESFVFLTTKEDESVYTMPTEVQEVVALYRSSYGHSVGSGSSIDPFSLAFAQNMYLINGFGTGLAGGGSGSLATYDFAAQHMETMGKKLGRDIMYTWTPSTKKLYLHRKVVGQETIAVHVYNQQPIEVLLADPYAYPWLKDYATAQAKMMLGQARSLYASLAGPQGGVTLNGSEMKSEAVAEMEKLEIELKDGVTARMGYGIFIG